MKHQTQKIKLSLIGIIAIAVGMLLLGTKDCSAVRLSYSPIRYSKILVPDSTEDMSITLTVPADAEGPAHYELEVYPFYIDDNGDTRFEAKDTYSEIVNWITIPEEDAKGIIKPNESKQINYKITVPGNAPAGGQYAVIIVKTYDDVESDIKQVYQMTQAVYAEVVGETIRGGEVISTNLPTILFSGNLTASATIRNDGNVHASAKHILKVFPLFGDEELFTNEENPENSSVIMPGASRLTSIAWESTPVAGIFRVKYSVEFEGVKNELEKIVIVCPLWLLIVIVLFIATIIYRLLTSAKPSKKTKKESSAEA